MSKERQKIVFVTAEMAPFAKAGGLADVAGALPAALARAGYSVDVYMPLYGSIDLAAHGIRAARENEAGWVDMAGEQESFQMFIQKSSAPRNLKVRFIASGKYFEGSDIYGEGKNPLSPELAESRFIFFQKAVLRRLEMAPEKPAVLHCNDHQTALLPYFIKTHSLASMRQIATVLTIHNLAYQGEAEPDLLRKAGIPMELFYAMSPFEFYGAFNQLKAGLVFADKLTTVSPSYAREIQLDPNTGAGLDGVLAERSADLTGILNGVDYNEWNPTDDQHLKAPFSARDLEGKAQNKRELQKQFGIKQRRKRIPLFGMIGRLVEQKGLDILIPALREALKDDIQAVVLGSGMPEYEKALKSLAAEYPEKMGVKIGYDNRLAHLLEAGSDIYLMPSRYEPCGLNQLYSMRYGTIPLVRATGGLADTVRDIRNTPEDGTGFSFKEFDSKKLLLTMKTAAEHYNSGKQWTRLMKRAMKKDFSWKAAASKYITVYEDAMASKREV